MADKPSPPAGDDDRRIADAELLFKDNAADRPQPDAPRKSRSLTGRRLCSGGAGRTRPEEGRTLPRRGARSLGRSSLPRRRRSPGRGKNSSPIAGHGRRSMTRTPSSRSGPGRGMGTDPGGPGGRRGDHRLGLRLAGLRGVVHARPRQRPGGRRGLHPLLLSHPHLPGTAGADHARAGRQGFLRLALAPRPAFPTDVAAAQHRGAELRPLLDIPRVQEILGRPARQAPRGACGAIQPPEIRGRRLQGRQEPGQDVRSMPGTRSTSGSGAVRAKAPSRSFRVETSLVKGQDRMWYLNEGFLPGE